MALPLVYGLWLTGLLVGKGDREMRDKFLVCSYVEGKGFLVVSELSAEGAVKTQEEIEREMAGDDSAEYLFVRDKAGELDLVLRQTQTACLYIAREKMGSLHLCPREGIAL